MTTETRITLTESQFRSLVESVYTEGFIGGWSDGVGLQNESAAQHAESGFYWSRSKNTMESLVALEGMGDWRPIESAPKDPIAESPECGTEKVWLCYAGEGFNLAKGSLPPKHREGSGPHVWNMPLESRWLEIGLEPDTARLIRPSHNLQPGECCEVPAREEHWMELEDLKAFRNAVALGKRTAINGECCVVIPERYIPLTAEEAEKAYDEAPAIPISPERINEIVQSVTGRLIRTKGERPFWEFQLAYSRLRLSKENHEEWSAELDSDETGESVVVGKSLRTMGDVRKLLIGLGAKLP